MNRIIIILALVAMAGLNAFSQDTAPAATTETKTTIEFNKLVNDYGEIEFMSDGACVFEFTNLGEEPLVLTNVRSSCGCTVPDWPKDPIKPGEKGVINVKYNTRSVGNFNKTITVYSNGQPSPIILRIKGTVKPKDSTPVQR
ncbi:MAG TPA: DUF1573 domain-containing protein [Tenuifilaceae bacterium]|nr:DUF1573 domain-containing protein [Tenuifilaceae bacterium]HPE19608.1 DUF1573 domain-containing protein [Tenuifilaceae bacterium]HPJ44565.1 DUF1573 domain-containing protein [Tenuifilaceae bacterium]HPQ34872.1 DUF1573 domain-containing protein [Tenuifilaceae bacterium]HRX67647.1 DUF1573 domain-containing protein [Tenuifilaceae bacterium]